MLGFGTESGPMAICNCKECLDPGKSVYGKYVTVEWKTLNRRSAQYASWSNTQK